MNATFSAAISLATTPVMVGFYLGGLCFVLGLIPAIGSKLIINGLDAVD